MKYLCCLLLVLSLALSGPVMGGSAPEVPKNPATITFDVAPTEPGADAAVTMILVPHDGIKINRYPKIKLTVKAADGVTPGAEAAVGNDRPPAPDADPEDNYYKGGVDPLEMTLPLAAALAPGEHEIPARLVYAFCVSASNFCTRTRVDVEIPVSITSR